MFRLLVTTVAASFALCGAALADSEPCVTPHVASVLPSPDASDVPTNARVLLEVRGQSCFDAPTFRLTHGGDPLSFELREWPVQGEDAMVYAIEPLRRLDKNAEYTVEVLGLDGNRGRGEFYRFATGDGALGATREAPRIRILDANVVRSGSSSEYAVTVEVAPTSDTAPFDQLRVTLDLGGDASKDEGDYPLAVVPDPEGWSSQHTFVQSGPTEDQLCVLVRQQDVAGQWSEATRACAPTEDFDVVDVEVDEHGCVAVPGAGGSAWAFLLLPLLGIRRRR